MSDAEERQVSDDQLSLGKALERALASEDRELAAQVRDGGLNLVRLLFGLLRLNRVHAADNQVFVKPLQDLHDVLEHLVDLLGVVHLIAVEDQVYVNDVRVRMHDRGEGAAELGQELRRLQVGGVSFHEVPSVDHLRVFIQAFGAPPLGVESKAALTALLAKRGADMLELHGLFRFRTSEQAVDQPEHDPRVVATRATSVVDETWDNLVGNRVPNPLPLRRAVTEILHMGPGLEGLWDDPRGSSAFGGHTLRVTRYALFLAQGCGLSEEAIQDLGLAVMFHDIGYAAREGAIAPSGKDPGDPGYAPPYERHSAAGARLLLRQRGFHEAKIRRALSALEHHRDYDHPGRRPSLFARIIRICEDYDNLVRRKGGNMAPPEAVARLISGAGTRYDPVLVKVFVNVMGAWPPGTLLQLEDGRLVRSVSTARSIETWATPLARIEVNADGTPASGLPRIDLALEGRVVRAVPQG